MFRKKLSRDYGLKQLVSPQEEPKEVPEPSPLAEIQKFFEALTRYYEVQRSQIAMDVLVQPHVHAQIKIIDQKIKTSGGSGNGSEIGLNAPQDQKIKTLEGDGNDSKIGVISPQDQKIKTSEGNGDGPEMELVYPQDQKVRTSEGNGDGPEIGLVCPQDQKIKTSEGDGDSSKMELVCPQNQKIKTPEEEKPSRPVPGKDSIWYQNGNFKTVNHLDLKDLLSILGVPAQLPGIKWIAKRRLMSFFEQKLEELGSETGQLVVRILDERGELVVHLLLNGAVRQKMGLGEVRKMLMG